MKSVKFLNLKYILKTKILVYDDIIKELNTFNKIDVIKEPNQYLNI